MNPAKDRGVFSCPDRVQRSRITGDPDRVITAEIVDALLHLIPARN